MNLLLDPARLSKYDRQFPKTLSELVASWMELPIVTLMGAFALFAVAFGNLVDVEADNDKVSMGGQALVKICMLAIGGIYGGIGFLTDLRVRKLLYSFPVMWMVILMGFFFLSVPFSPTPLPSLASTISIACVLLLTTTALVQLGVRVVLKTFFAALGLYVILSWAAFVLVPSIGVFQEATVEGQTVARMGGLAHPNTLGQLSGLTLVFGLLIYQLESKLSKLHALILMLALGSLLFSLSRTSLMATMIAVVVVYRSHIFRRRYLFNALVIGAVGLFAILVAAVVFDLGNAIQSKIGLISKSGEADELLSATGRTDIWAYALRLVSDRPLTGFGAATSKLYLVDYSLHTHNLVINVAFSTGLIGGLVALWMCLERFFRIIFYHHPLADGMIAFILFNGLFENVIFSILAGIPTMIWITGLALPLLGEDEANRVMFDRRDKILEEEQKTSPRPQKWSLAR